MSQPRILVSNDDGIHAPGIKALAEAMESVGEVWVVAPDGERSAISHAISLHNPLRLTKRGERTFSCDGTPTDSVYMGLHGILPSAPDIVVSGINHGPNLGNDVLYSGTVSAAMEGALYGHRAIAFSMGPPYPKEGPNVWHFESAADVAIQIVKSALRRPMPPGVLLNVNVPNRPRDEIQGIKLCRLGYTDWAEAVEKRRDPRGRSYYWIGGERRGHDDIPDSDNNAMGESHVTITPVHYDITDYRSFDYTRGLDIQGLDWAPDNLGNDPLPHPVHPRLGQEG